jgi:hypothetical protein
MPAPTRHVDEAAVLSSLCGMTLAGLRAMHGRTSTAPIRHLILQVIGLKEDESREAATHARKKPKSKTAKQPG